MEKTGIRRRILFLLLTAGLITFIGLSTISLLNLYQGRSDALSIDLFLPSAYNTYREIYPRQQGIYILQQRSEVANIQ